MRHSKTMVVLSIFALSSLLFSCSNESPIIELETQTSAEQIEKELAQTQEVNDDSIEFVSQVDFKIPEGYVLFDKTEGDLNGDGINDHVLMIKGTDSTYIVINRFDVEVDRNRRGVLIFLSAEDNYFLATKNLSCFYSDQEDGGVYYPPELSMSIRNNKLYFDYAHGRYGFWQYTFRYQNSSFALIGYDASENYGPIVNQEVSINFLTKKKLTRKNINQDIEESGDEIFEDTWEDLDSQRLFKLSEIKDFEEFDVP